MKRLSILFLITVSLSTLFAQVDLTESAFKLVNSGYDEQNPVISPDGKMLFMTIRSHPQNIDGKRDPGDIWISSWSENHWPEPVHAGPLLNDRGYNGVAGFSADGTKLYLLSHYDASGLARTQGISVSRKTPAGWTRPENIFIPYFQNKSSIQSGHITADGRVFIYSAETYGSYGVDDLYITIRGNDGKWSEPKNMGPGINTQFQELSPSLSADGNTLYFSSNGRRGLGSFDIFTSTRLDDTYTNWSEPVNIGSDINSDGRELYFRTFEFLGISVYASTKNSDGYGDIKFKTGKKIIPDSTVLTQQVIPVEIYNNPVTSIDIASVRIYGRVLNSKNGEPIAAKISFIGTDTSVVATATTSGFGIVVPARKKYSVDVEAAGYISTLEKLDLQVFEMRELEMNLNLQPIEIGTTVNLKNVLFMQSQPELLPESYSELDLVVAFLKANPQVEIELAGHTDNRGSFRQLMSLSQKRVNRVKDYLASKGIDKKRITGKGYGGTKPVASNDTEEQRMLNRRVEFIIKKL